MSPSQASLTKPVVQQTIPNRSFAPTEANARFSTAVQSTRTTRMTPMSSDTFDLVEAARRCAQAAWPKDQTRAFGFTKAGVLLDDLLRFEDRPLTLFDAQNPKSQALMTALDQVNQRFGKKTMVLASEGMKRPWSLRSDHRSPRYTTRLSDLPVVR
jgi:DNA polymerase V